MKVKSVLSYSRAKYSSWAINWVSIIAATLVWAQPVFKAWLNSRIGGEGLVDLTAVIFFLIAVLLVIKTRIDGTNPAKRLSPLFIASHTGLAILMVVSLGWTGAPEYGLTKSGKYVVFSSLSVLAGSLVSSSGESLRRFVIMMCTLSFIVAVAVIFFPSFQDLGEKGRSYRVSAFESNPLNAAIVMSTTASLLPILAIRGWFWMSLCSLIAVVCLAGVLGTESRSMLVQAPLAWMVFLLVWGKVDAIKKIGGVVLGLAGVVSVISFGLLASSARISSSFSNIYEAVVMSDRMAMWKFALTGRSVDLFFGRGVGAFARDWLGYDVRYFPHNLFLESLYEEGVLGLSCLVFLIYSVFFSGKWFRRRLFQHGDFCGCWSAAFASLVAVSVHWDLADCRLVWFLFGMVFGASGAIAPDFNIRPSVYSAANGNRFLTRSP